MIVFPYLDLALFICLAGCSQLIDSSMDRKWIGDDLDNKSNVKQL